MRLGLIGYGRMGHLVEQVALARGHEIALRLDEDNNKDSVGLTPEALSQVETAIEFSVPSAVVANVQGLIALGIPTVVGTTGWYRHLDEIRSLVEKKRGTLVYGTNFSLGMNLFFRLVQYASELFGSSINCRANFMRGFMYHLPWLGGYPDGLWCSQPSFSSS